MKTAVKELAFAVAAWLIPFAASVAIFPLKKAHSPLFDSLMGVVLTTSTVVLGLLYLRRRASRPVAAGLRAGVLWMVANWLLDGLMFSGGPMKMTFTQYAGDIGAAYLMIPVVTTGLGAAVTLRRLELPPV
jgi:hypothetical protein